MAEWGDYEWIVVVGSIVAFFMAWSIGANDVANSFATSVGSKSITIFQAVLIATVCEFLGAMLLGGQVVKTIAGGIADVNAFVEDPEFLMYGMMCALTSAACWVTFATTYGLAVSTTHSIVGAIMGFALVYKGSDAVLWYQKAVVVSTAAEYTAAKARTNYIVADDQVPIRGLVPIVISWFTSPVCCALIGALHFFLVRTLVMRRRNALYYSYFALPVVVFYCIFMNTFFVVYKGGKTGVCTKGKENKAENPRYSKLLCKKDITGSPTVRSEAAAWIAVAVAGGIAGLTAIFIVPFVIRRAQRMDADGNVIDAEGKPVEEKAGDKEVVESATPTADLPWYRKAYNAATYGMTYDIHKAVEGDQTVAAVHQNAEKFDPRAEASFQPVQVFTSACVSFAHGANDVANSVGALAAIYQVYKSRTAVGTADLPTWILALGATGLVVGLATYGYNIMRVLGTEMVLLTPCRGFCAELATAMVVSVGSMYGFPLSTTHSQTGSTVGVGLLEGGVKGVNWLLFLKQIVGWVMTIIVAGLLSAALFAQAIYAPSAIMARDIGRYEQNDLDITTALVNSIAATHDILKRDVTNATFAAGVTGATFSSAFEKSYLTYARSNLTQKNKDSYFQSITLKNGAKVFKRRGVITSQELTAFVTKTVKIFQSSCVLTFGSNATDGLGWNKSAFQAQRGSDFAKLP